jgi:hypothetical protein
VIQHCVLFDHSERYVATHHWVLLCGLITVLAPGVLGSFVNRGLRGWYSHMARREPERDGATGHWLIIDMVLRMRWNRCHLCMSW